MITLTQSYLHLPQSTYAQTPVKGRAFDGYWSQTVARNAAQIVSKGRAPVILCGWGVPFPGSVSSLSLTPIFGRGFVPLPYNAVTICFKASSASGEVKVYLSGSAWPAYTPNTGDASHDFTITGGTVEVYTASVDVSDLIGTTRMLYCYVEAKSVLLYYFCAYAANYTG